jgi:dynein intermediate chain
MGLTFLLQEKVIYNKEVQTTPIATEPSGPSEAEIRLRIQREHEYEKAMREKELDEISVQLDKEIEEEIRGTMRMARF